MSGSVNSSVSEPFSGSLGCLDARACVAREGGMVGDSVGGGGSVQRTRRVPKRVARVRERRVLVDAREFPATLNVRTLTAFRPF